MIPGFGRSEVIMIIYNLPRNIRCYRVCLRSKWHEMTTSDDVNPRTHDAMVTKIDQRCFLTLLEHVGTHRSQVHNLFLCFLQNKDELKVSILDEPPNLKSVPSKSPIQRPENQSKFPHKLRRTRHHQSIACSQNPTCNPGDAGIPWDLERSNIWSKEWSGNDPFASLKIEGTKRG